MNPVLTEDRPKNSRGEPQLRSVIPFSRIDCSGNEQRYISEVLESGWLTTASKSAELESRISEMTGATHALAVNSCTSALHLALVALDIQPGDKVLVPTWTFAATAEVVQYLQAVPVFLDVDYATGTITAENVEAAIQAHPDAKVLMVVHYGGQAAPMLDSESPGIVSVCRKHGLRIVEDAAHAFPARDGEVAVGNIGDITCFSFYANKTMTTGEGGMLLTNDDEIAKRARVMRLHGIDRDVWARFTQPKAKWEYDVIAAGFKYNMPDINAALGLAQLERLQPMRAHRQAVAKRYADGLSSLPALTLPSLRVHPEHHAWHLYTVYVNSSARMSRNELIDQLQQDGIGTSVHYKPLHRLSYYRDTHSLRNEDFPVAEQLWKESLSLPIYSLLSMADVDYIVERLHVHIGGNG